MTTQTKSIFAQFKQSTDERWRVHYKESSFCTHRFAYSQLCLFSFKWLPNTASSWFFYFARKLIKILAVSIHRPSCFGSYLHVHVAILTQLAVIRRENSLECESREKQRRKNDDDDDGGGVDMKSNAFSRSTYYLPLSVRSCIYIRCPETMSKKEKCKRIETTKKWPTQLSHSLSLFLSRIFHFPSSLSQSKNSKCFDSFFFKFCALC